MELQELKEFADRPGINKSGLCSEIGISLQYFNRIIKGSQPITDSFVEKSIPILISYGWNDWRN